MRWTVSAATYHMPGQESWGRRHPVTMKAQQGTGLQDPLGQGPAHPNTGVNKLQMGQTQSAPL